VNVQELSMTLRDDRPMPSLEFTRALDARAATGFARAGREVKPRSPRAWLAPVLASAVLIVIAVSAIVMSGRNGATEVQKTVPAAGAPAIQAAPLPGSAPPASRVRKVERAGSITLAPPAGEIETVADGVIRTADRYRGFVQQSSVTSGDQDPGATIDLRIPTSSLQAALADISRLAHVKARSQQGLDITSQFSAPRRHLADATAERRTLLTQLAKAQTPNQTASIRARLRLAEQQIQRAQLILRRLQNRVDYAAISVSVVPGAKAGGGRWTTGDAVGNALDVLEALAGAALVGLAVLVPAGLLFAVLWVARRAYLRRAREGALGPVEKPTGR
jgi:Domain of unknown function (DUF4349)